MNCSEAEPFVSVLYDGEPLPVEVANHVDGCRNCRARLRSYSEMGAELRLMASKATHATSPFTLRDKLRPPHRPTRLAFLRVGVLVPRFALALLAAALVATSASIVILRAQSEARPLWFQFGVNDRGLRPGLMSHVAKAGSDDEFVIWRVYNPIGVHIAVTTIKEKSVQLRIRARNLGPGGADNGYSPKKELGDLQNHEFTYTVDDKLDIPVEGGGVLALQGQVVDHQPKIAWGMPVEPGTDQIVLTNPLVISGETLLANLQGANSIAPDRNWGGRIYVPGTGEIVIALQPIPGAVQGEANWGSLNFTWQGRDYQVRTASPITGGDQPRAVWVTLDSEHPWAYGKSWQLGGAPLTPAAKQIIQQGP
jgi:hypothetical protein